MARTVANGLITQALIDTQKDASRTPYIDISINDNAAAGVVNYWSRLEYLEYTEEPYRDRAIIGLNNRDNALDAIDMDGQSFAIKLGYDTTAHGGSTTDTVTYPTLWVKSHQIISDQGERIYQIYAEGAWMRLREQRVITGVTGPQDELYSSTFNKTHTVYDIIELIIEGAMGWTLIDSPPDDGIIDGPFMPVLDVNRLPFEHAAALLYRLIWMTKEYLRQRAGTTFQCVYPQDDDPVDLTYYSDKANWFIEYVEKTILLIPNKIVVLANQDPETGDWDSLVVGEAFDYPDNFDVSGVYTGNYAEIIQPFVVGSITNKKDADDRASAILTRLKAETLGARMVAPHDCQLELYDKILVLDSRT